MWVNCLACNNKQNQRMPNVFWITSEKNWKKNDCVEYDSICFEVHSDIEKKRYFTCSEFYDDNKCLGVMKKTALKC